MSKEEERGGLDTEGEEEVREKEKGEENAGEEGDEDSEDEEEESEEEEVGIALQLPQRATRGLAYQRLIGEALEEDQAFWSHNTWADEEEDADYNCSEGEEVYEDVVDSDFDRPEDDEEGDSSSDGEGEEGDEGEGRCRRGTSATKQASRKEKKRKKKRTRDTEDDEEEAGEEKKKSRKQAFELMWKRRRAKREREEKQRKEEKKKARAKQYHQQKREEEEKRQPEVKSEEEQRPADRRGKEQEEEKPQLKQGGKERLLGVKRRQLRLTRGRNLRRGDGSSSSSTSDGPENKSSSSSSQKRKHRQKQKKPSERPRAGGGTVREMTLEEHLEEARRTEEKNLEVLLAMEERDEARRLRHVFDLKKSMYAGDYDRYFSWASWLVVGDQATEEAEAAPAAESVAADTKPLEQMHQEVKKQQEQQANIQKQEWRTNTETEPTFCDSKLETAERMKTGKGEETEEKDAATAAAPATQGDTDESGGAEKSGVYLRSVKEEDALAGEAGKHNVRAAEGPATAAAAQADAAGSNDGAASASSVAGKEGGTERRTSETFGCGILEGKEETVQGNEECSTKFPSLVQVSSNSLSLSPQEHGEQQLLQHRPPEQQHPSRQQGTQTQQQQQASEGGLGQQHGELEQKPTQHQTVDHVPSGCIPAAEKAAAGETGARPAGDEEDGEEPRESEGYAMELRMFTEGKFPDMYIQQPASARKQQPNRRYAYVCDLSPRDVQM